MFQTIFTHRRSTADHPSGWKSTGPADALRELGDVRTCRSGDSPRAGSALVIVLGMLSVLLLMGVAFSVTMRTERSGASNMRHAEMARHMLDSALARTLSDLDAALLRAEVSGRTTNWWDDACVPTSLVVAVSGSGDSDITVNVLSHEAARHLPGDQLAAALYANAGWLPIYGGVRISTTSDQDPTSEDSPVGRYAYVILNNCGLLDPNVVASSNRLFGMTPFEVDIKGANGKVLDLATAGTANNFKTIRRNNGHYVNMRDFLRPEITTRIIPNAVNFQSSRRTFSTNYFSVGSMAVEDLIPSFGTDNGSTRTIRAPVRRPKFPLADEDGNPVRPSDLSSDDLQDMVEYFRLAISSTQKINCDDRLPPNFFAGTDRIDYHLLIARNLLDALDDDNIPGGSQPHNISGINRNDYDSYVAKLGGGNRNWDRFPCTEPMPMLDNLVLVAGHDWAEPIEFVLNREDPLPTDPPGTLGNVTNVTVKLHVGLWPSSAIYLGWNVPSGAEGMYAYKWKFSGSLGNPYEDGNDPDFHTAFVNAINATTLDSESDEGHFNLSRVNFPTLHDWRNVGSTTADFIKAFDVVFTIDNVTSIADAQAKIPDNFGFEAHATGFLYKGNNSDVRQVAPCLIGNDNSSSLSQASSLDINLWFQKNMLLNPSQGNVHIVGGAYCVDPKFAYNKDSWISSQAPDSQGGTLPEDLLQEALTFHDETAFSSGGYDVGLNPLTRLYLKDPRRKFGGTALYQILRGAESLVGGCSDVMWANPAARGEEFPDSKCDEPNDAARAFYIDPRQRDRTKPDAFTRVGQLGFLPIGTFRTIALLDGFGTVGNGVVRVPRQRVLDYFTMHPERDPGTVGSPSRPGDPVKPALFTSRVNLNPPRTVSWSGSGNNTTLETDDYNPKPLAAVLNGCPLREWAASGSQMPVSWETAEAIAEGFLEAIDPTSGSAIDDAVEDEPDGWNEDGVVHDISVLGRCVPDDLDLSIDAIIRNETQADCDFDREGIIRNTSEMLTTRQQLFTILLKADSFTPKFGYNDAEHGTSLASAQAIAHVWRDPEPLRDADGNVLRDNDDKPIHPWVLLDLYQF